jgi:dihydrodipicolinate synthase/N-acetylneuraminate lyase
MTGDSLAPEGLAASLIAEPPLALRQDFEVARDVNERLAVRLRAAGISTLLYGGNANLFSQSLAQYAQSVELMGAVAEHSTVIAGIGPDLGKMLDQAGLIERAGLRNVMLLPLHYPADTHGTGDGVRRIADRLGFGVIVDLCRENYLRPVTLRKLKDERAVSFAKYSVRRDNPEDDAYLDRVIEIMGRDRVISGLGEAAALDHIGKRKLPSFVSGAASLVPSAANRLFKTLQSGNLAEGRSLLIPFLEFDRLRMALGAIQVLHDAVSVAGIANMGPQIPMLSPVKAKFRDDLEAVVRQLMQAG